MNFGTESETLEFKKSTGELADAMKSVCAMLNKHGFGTVYFGIFPSGEAKGQEVSDSTLRDVSRKVYESISPTIVPSVSKKSVDGKDIIELSFKGSDRPYSCRGVYYIRSADEDRILPNDELRRMFLYDAAHRWDEELSEHTVEDISVATLKSFYAKATACGRVKDLAYEPASILAKLHLLRDGRLTNAGYYLFGKGSPVTLKLAVFASDEKLTFLDINRAEGNILDLIEVAYEYVKKNMRWRARIDDFKRVETPEIPLSSLREIICNGFAHARYQSFTQHEITIHPGKIRIYNPGEFPIGYRPEDFARENLASIARNPLILKTLFLSDDVEPYGSGFKKVFKECEEAEVGVEYSLDRDGFTFAFLRNQKDIDSGDPPKRGLDDEEATVVSFIKKDPYSSAAKIGKTIGKSPRTIQRIFARLREDGLLRRNGTKGGYWELMLGNK
ncbi:MAG: putative DNA binding domain-containing protein [Bacilli bacterium]|nr:putative DNA binding domain-containing protein [Bacilli bacterium]